MIRLTRTALLLSTLLVFQIPLAKAQSIEDERALAVELMGRIDVGALIDGIMPQVIEQNRALVKKAYPDLTDEVWNGVGVVLSNVFKRERDAFVTMMAEIYVEEFSYQELVDLKAFYETPTGRALVKKTPALTTKGYQIGSEWGKGLGEKIGPELESYLKSKGL